MGKLRDELRGGQDGNALPRVQDKEIVIAADDCVSLCGKSQGKKEIVARVTTRWSNIDDIFLENYEQLRFLQNEADKLVTIRLGQIPIEPAPMQHVVQLRQTLVASA